MPEWITDLRVLLAIAAAIGGIGYWVGQVNSDRKSFKRFMQDVREDIRTIQRDIKAILTVLPQPFVIGTSPVALTDRGERAAEILNARRWAKERAGDLFARCKGLKEYEIHGLCERRVMEDRSKWPDNMAECAYEFGTRVERLADVLIVVLRDELIERLGDVGSEGVQDR